MAHGQYTDIRLADMTLLAQPKSDGHFCAVVIFLGHRYELTCSLDGKPLTTIEDAENAARSLARTALFERFEELLTHAKWGAEDEV